jgi:hypothetical protein
LERIKTNWRKKKLSPSLFPSFSFSPSSFFFPFGCFAKVGDATSAVPAAAAVVTVIATTTAVAAAAGGVGDSGDDGGGRGGVRPRPNLVCSYTERRSRKGRFSAMLEGRATAFF